MTRTVAELERALRPDDWTVGAPDLESIRAQGRRRRRRSTTSLAAGAVAAVTVATLVVTGTGWPGADDVARDAQPLSAPLPDRPSELGRRALAQLPGAERVSPYHVSVPAPAALEWTGEVIGPDRIVRGPVDLPAHAYTGLTMWERDVWPGWLYDGVAAAERAAGDEAGHPVGSFAEGIVVDQGPLLLACVAGRGGGDACSPTVLHREGGDAVLDWGFGTDRFLDDGAPMEVFLTQNWSTGELTQLAIGGLDGTEVARAVFVTVDGRRVEGAVESGTIVEGDTLFYADVPGELARVVAYDAAGAVVEDHELRPCGDPVDCEVR